jgi:hypothetical protein
MLVILLGVAAFALDLGRLYVLRTEMQNAVDAAALSAAAELDGEEDSHNRARLAANQEMLNHLAHFSNKSELLENLQTNPAIFTFYTWIGSINDPSDPPDGCSPPTDPDDPDFGKCRDDDEGNNDVTYVKITLNPALLGNDGRYEIDLYFLPVLNVFGIPTATSASSQVEALAGSHSQVCEYPPMFICDPTEVAPGYPGVPLTRGQMVKLKEQGPGAPWAAGTFGWLIPTEVEADPDDDGLGVNQLLAHRLGSIYGHECGPPILEINPGNIANWPRWGLNTRFGLYQRPEHRNVNFASAPNVVDYPRDDNLTDNSTCEDNTNKFGDPFPVVGDVVIPWLTETECADRPSTFNQSDYNVNFHEGLAVPTGMTRAQYYDWELLNSTRYAEPSATLLASLDSDEEACTDSSNIKCRMLYGDPRAGVLLPLPDYVDDDDSDKRRELFVSAIACIANDVGSNSIINVEEVGGRWMKFFMTEHVSPATDGVTIYAEFVEEVEQSDDEHFKRVIQLYE